MRKVLLVSLVVFTVIVAGGVCISWFLQSVAIKRDIERIIAKLNEQQTYVTYESIETSGFPTDVVASIVKPRFTGRVDQLLAMADQKKGRTPRQMPEWNEDITLDGRINFGINALSSRFFFTISGDWYNTSTIGGQSISLFSQSPGDFTCMLQVKSGWTGTLWSFKSMAEQGKQFAEDFRSLDCTHPGYLMSNAGTKETLASSGPMRLYVQHEPNGGEQFRFYVKSTDTEVTAAGDNVFDLYFKALASNPFTPLKLSLYGKQNIEIDFSYHGPTDWATAKDAPVDINLSKMDISSQVYNSSTSFQLASHVNGGQRSAKLVLNSQSQFSEQYDQLWRESVRQIMAELMLGRDPKMAGNQDVMKKHTPEEWAALVQPAVPNFHSLGKTVLALDASYAGNDAMTDGELTLTNLEISASPYGITGQGIVKRTQGQMFPAANITLMWRNCLRMIDDMAAYTNRVRKVMAEFETAPPAQPTTIDPKLVEGIKVFLAELATTKGDSTTFIYAIVSDGAGNITVNGKPLDQVMMLYNEKVAPFMKPAVTGDASPPGAAGAGSPPAARP